LKDFNMTEWLGKTIGRVRIEKLLARGGMAEVYLGTHMTLERQVAIKLLQSHIEGDPDLLERFHREAKVVAGLRHSNIVQIFDFDTIDGHPYIVMEFLRGPTLANYLRALHDRDERIPLSQVARLLNELTAAIDYAHGQGVIHRDIKPGNIMLQKKSGEFLPGQPLTDDVDIILTDFGLVRIAHAATHTAIGTVSGTPAYMSPEQARGDKTDHRTDIYSLGIVLYEMLAGRVPFEADSQLSVIYMHINNRPPPIAAVSEAIQAIIDRALAKDPNDRYQSSGEIAADFSRALEKEQKAEAAIETRVVAPEEKVAPPVVVQKQKPARSRSWLGVGVFSLVCLLALGAGAWGMTSFLPSFTRPTPTIPPTTVVVDDTATLPVPVTGGLPGAEGMVKVSADTYEVGLSSADGYHSAPHQVELKEFWIDQYQVSNEQYAKFMQETGTPAPVVWPGDNDHPVRGVSWDQAVAYCGWLDKRLPTEAEWEAAGRGTGSEPQLFPWGNDPTASGQTSGFPDEDTYGIGTMSFNKSPADVYDLVGNVWEWVGEPYANGPQGTKFMHGGRFGLPVVDLAYRLAIAPGDTRYIKYAGFRCAADQVR
jgi:eukaryotic-like serine/threonine-protein kinase